MAIALRRQALSWAVVALPTRRQCAGSGWSAALCSRRFSGKRKAAEAPASHESASASAADVSGQFRREMRIEGVTVVATPDAALHAVSVLRRFQDRVHGWDTETADLVVGRSIRVQSPVTHGRIVCATCFCGDDVDFGSGPRLFIDNSGPAAGILAGYFKEYFEDASFKKVFHNYSFDRHVLHRHGISLKGFEADTLHLARLHDTSLAGWEGAAQRQLGLSGSASNRDTFVNAGRSPSSLSSSSPSGTPGFGMRLGGSSLDASVWASTTKLHTMANSQSTPSPLLSAILAADEFRRSEQQRQPPKPKAVGYGLKSLASHFGIVDGHRTTFSELFGLHHSAAADAIESPETFPILVRYSTEDAELTYRLYVMLKARLEKEAWYSEVHSIPMTAFLSDREVAKQMLKNKSNVQSVQQRPGSSLWTFADTYLREVGECLADLEQHGVGVDRDRLKAIQAEFETEVKKCHDGVITAFASFKDPSGKLICSDVSLLNPQSTVQLRTLLFGGAKSIREHVDSCIDAEKDIIVAKKGDTPKSTFHLSTLGLTPKRTKKANSQLTGLPKVANHVVRQLAGSAENGFQGVAYAQLIHLGYSEDMAKRACEGLWHLARGNQLRRLLSSVVKPLTEFSDAGERIHPSWMLDTSTGRLACRSPNLQNLPRDASRIRDAIVPRAGNALIKADYAQLELCVLAHLSGDASMVQKLSTGGDYHSEVAAEMFPYIRDALAAGEVAMTAKGAKDGVPLVKVRFATERTQAKAINFGIIYGQCATTLAEDLGITPLEADVAMKRWFDGKPGVRDWIAAYGKQASTNQRVLSLLGRPRHMPLLAINVPRMWQSKSLRAAINFGVQGSAADVVTSAMLRIWKDALLRRLGFRLVMQVHDEFVLEGPKAAAEQALCRVQDLMVHPFAEQSPEFKLRTPLRVDATIASSLSGDP